MPSRPRRPPAPDDAEQTAAPAEAADDAAELLAAADAFEAGRRRVEARMAVRVPDDQLDQLPDLELLEEARRRGCVFTRAVTRTQIIDAAIAATTDPAGEAGTT
jgi:hypothetical protein